MVTRGASVMGAAGDVPDARAQHRRAGESFSLVRRDRLGLNPRIAMRQRGFVRAEVIGWEDLVACGGYAPARDRGKLRIEGRDYVVADGDVITIKV